ncbi:MAG TPA: LLM class flavin-dependent oxidoreductase [Solirubrobacterales bacterium]|jgi:alkanesulfonate monooxygenase SsuD/methylene tetrahydromethanopterin reductase-like flavin-dependent oxidoreductase (luciferase family)|nr:LLM class flavin-dependent oxidoreductase [Solirubrobacterales bacterium]
MDVAIGLPSTVPGTSGDRLLEWARRAEARGFSSLGTIDRIVYDNYEPLLALAAAAAVTKRIGLCTSVLLGPLRSNHAELAKQALSLNAISGGRFTLGIALGGREDDYEVSGVEFRGRGKRFDRELQRIKEIWEGGEVGPSAAPPPRLVVGGHAEASFKRAARFGEGWIAGGAAPEEYAAMLGKVKAAWGEAGREGEPRAMGLAYFGLGENAVAEAREELTGYYAWLGEEIAGYIADSAATDAETVKQYLSAFEGAGCQELILFPTSSDPAQVDLLADAAGL